MRSETLAWLAQADADRRAAATMVEAGHYYMAAFLSHQMVEKAMKGAFIETRRDMPPKTHNLVLLARELGAPEEVVSRARLINAEYVCARYPDAANGVPADNYDEPKARMLLDAAEGIRSWIDSILEPTN